LGLLLLLLLLLPGRCCCYYCYSWRLALLFARSCRRRRDSWHSGDGHVFVLVVRLNEVPQTTQENSLGLMNS
jgi:hypothetical protein